MRYVSALVLFAGLCGAAESPTGTFTNPLLPSGADPSVAYSDGFYYYMQTTGRNLTIWKVRDITNLREAEIKVVWRPPAAGPYSRDIWAPELHRIRGKWYIYFCADAGTNESHRLWVIQNGSRDPLQGQWVMKGKLADASNKWAIDPTVFANRGKLYVLWSGWEDDVDGRQSIYIARLKNPWTIKGPRVRISTPQFGWERIGDLPSQHRHVDVNEGPEILKHDSKLFLIYSASGCWTDAYSLGMSVADAGSDPLNPKSWKKVEHPVLSGSAAAHAFGTGHNTFFESTDGKQDWIIYHANPETGEGCGAERSPRAQPFKWNADGTPDFGRPVPLGVPLRKPN